MDSEEGQGKNTLGEDKNGVDVALREGFKDRLLKTIVTARVLMKTAVVLGLSRLSPVSGHLFSLLPNL